MADKNRDLGQQGKGLPGEGMQQDRSDQESGRPVQLDEKGKGRSGRAGQSGERSARSAPASPTGTTRTADRPAEPLVDQ